jgi:putative DNA primase/helicase
MLNEACSAYRAGLCILPVASDGTKRPDVLTWAGYQTTRPTVAQMRAFRFERRTGFGMIAGPVSGRRGAWDFDDANTHAAFVAAANASGLGDVVRRIEAGYCDQTPGGGRRWIVHYPESAAWRDETLARRPGGEGEPTIKTLIELPTFAILAPSHGPTHPSGRPYTRLSGGFTTIAAVNAGEHADLVALARTFDAMPRRQPGDTRPAHQSGHRPGDEFNRHAS